MAHVPHLLLPRPWEGDLPLSASQVHHLEAVLRIKPGQKVSYTDGRGTRGIGQVQAGMVLRETEEVVGALPDLELAVAPPHERDRVRWLVEKAVELEVTRIRWLKTRYGNAHRSHLLKARDWAVMAVEQSRGAWLTQVDAEMSGLVDLSDGLRNVVADPAGDPLDRFELPLRVMIGPEGGWEPTELGTAWPRVGLGRTILRIETAAIVAAALLRSSNATKMPGD